MAHKGTVEKGGFHGVSTYWKMIRNVNVVFVVIMENGICRHLSGPKGHPGGQ